MMLFNTLYVQQLLSAVKLSVLVPVPDDGLAEFLAGVHLQLGGTQCVQLSEEEVI